MREWVILNPRDLGGPSFVLRGAKANGNLTTLPHPDR